MLGASSFAGFAGGDRRFLINGATNARQEFGVGGSQIGGLYADANRLVVYTSSTDHLSFQTNGTERVQIASTGALALMPGCPGIDFSGTQTNNSGMLSETLDTYEVGVWNVTPTNATWTVQRATYVKVGRQVTVFFSGAISSPSAAVARFPLPFTSDTSTSTGTVAGVEAHGSVMINSSSPPSNTFNATVYCWNTEASIYFSRPSASWFNALASQLGTAVQFTATYLTD
jgi:hypothetical protein